MFLRLGANKICPARRTTIKACILVAVVLIELTTRAAGQRNNECDDSEYEDCECNHGKPGLKGEPGNKGNTGDTGSKGFPGPVGENGLNGTAGPPGKPGLPGSKGEQGRMGDKGLPGLNGEQGKKGNTGDTGPQGFPGPDGKNGLNGAGSPGKPGLPGSKGEQGPIGMVTEGAAGLKGEKGERGLDGTNGKDGSTGPQGPPGPSTIGLPGINGTNGRMGDKGLPGLDGPIGPPGFPGLPGNCEKGRDGADGTPGRDGNNGNAGPPGIGGPPGPKGEQGPIGATGLTGEKGEKGRDGTDGIPGKNGNNGINGIQGPPGPPGSCGNIDYPVMDDPSPRNALFRSCKDIEKRIEGQYAIDPNGGDGVDAINVQCQFSGAPKTCLKIIPEEASHQLSTILTSQTTWISSRLNSTWMINNYDNFRHQIPSLQLLSKRASQQLKYICPNSSQSLDITLIGWNEAVVHSDSSHRLHYQTIYDGCKKNNNLNERTEILFETGNPFTLPFIDVGLKVNSIVQKSIQNNQFMMEFGFLCFYD